MSIISHHLPLTLIFSSTSVHEHRKLDILENDTAVAKNGLIVTCKADFLTFTV